MAGNFPRKHAPMQEDNSRIANILEAQRKILPGAIMNKVESDGAIASPTPPTLPVADRLDLPRKETPADGADFPTAGA